MPWRAAISRTILALAAGGGALAQGPPTTFASATRPAPSPAAEPADRRITELEAANRLMADQLKQIQGRLTEMGQLTGSPQAVLGLPNETLEQARRPGTGGSPVPDYTEGAFPPFQPAPGYPASNILNPNRFPLHASFGSGFLLQTADDRFRLQIHYESQVEGRVWNNSEQLPANSGIFLPRQRIFFDGHITKWVEYEFAINRGLNNLNVLNAYINLHLDDRLQLRFGRFFSPMLYEQYAVSNYWLIVPERSPFTTNLSLNRQFGAMLWGYLLDERLDYAAGVFNGSRNAFENQSSNLDFVGFVNARPFQESEQFEALKFLNVGTSVAYGSQDQAPVPQTFRIAGGSPDANIPGAATVPFLILNNNVVERGERLVGSAHAAWFHKSLSLIGEWQYGFGEYASPARPDSERVPFSGFYVAAGYFLTGEEVERRTRVKPLRPLIPVGDDEARGCGALEIAGRVAQLKLGDEIFNAGFADRNLWSNSVVTTELGVNWYWNEYIKMYAFWLHGEFGEPVQFRPGRFQKSADLFWLRFQLYF